MKLIEIPVKIERACMGGETWAMQSMTFAQRLKFYRDTGEWPGQHSDSATTMFIQGDINNERRDGKSFCANQKLRRAIEAGLDIR
jgi:hypothetical protein